MATPYLRGKKYYFKYTDSEGKRKQKCTDTDDYEKACAFISAFDASIQEKKFVMPTFLEELHKYQDINTNPKYQRVLLEGGNYSKPWAIRVASYTKQLEGIIKATTPSVLLKKLNEVSRMEISDISKAIAKARGKSRTSQLMQQSLKVVFSTAYEDGVLSQSPAMGIKCITYKQNKRESIPSEFIQEIISHKDWFFDYQAWAYFVIIATTGMRKNELIALSSSKINNGTCLIDSNIQGTNREINALPKWGIIRTIPLPKITQQVISTLSTTKDAKGNDRFFYKDTQWVQKVFDTLRFSLRQFYPVQNFSKLTAHVLRHSCNTNLLLTGLSPLLVSEYMSWEHQELSDIQKNYTHLVAENLRPVADKVDKMYHI